jgi:hypothetical protein
MADPGTTLVFQMPDGALVAPEYPYTTGDVWWRGPRAVFVVDIQAHPVSFECPLPSNGDAVAFDASVAHSWSVWDPVAVVRGQIDAPAACRGYLVKEMRTLTRRFKASEVASAEEAIHGNLGRSSIDLLQGIRISGLNVQLRLDPDQARLARELQMAELKQNLAETEETGRGRTAALAQESELDRRKKRLEFFEKIFAAGGSSVAAGMVAEDPSKIQEAASFMADLWRQDEGLVLQAMKVLLDSDQIRIGETGGAVEAVLKRFEALLSQAGNDFSRGMLTSRPSGNTPELPNKTESSEERSA